MTHQDWHFFPGAGKKESIRKKRYQLKEPRKIFCKWNATLLNLGLEFVSSVLLVHELVSTTLTDSLSHQVQSVHQQPMWAGLRYPTADVILHDDGVHFKFKEEERKWNKEDDNKEKPY